MHEDGQVTAPMLLGVVLCGGESTRMGEDKASLAIAGVTMIERAVRVLAPLVGEVVLASGTSARYEELGLEYVVDKSAGEGPLAGLVAAMERLVWAPGEVPEERRLLLVLACDMPRADARVFEQLIERIEADESDVCMLRDGEGIEPLFGVYRATAFSAMARALSRGQRRLVSFHSAVQVAFVDIADLPDDIGQDPAINVNTPDEFAAESKVAATIESEAEASS